MKKMNLFRKANSCLRLMENGIIAYNKIFEATMKIIKAHGLEEEFWQYAGKH